MAMSMNLSCCLKPPSQSPPSISSPLLPQRLAICKDSIVFGTKARCISIAAACIVIGLVDAADSPKVVMAVDRLEVTEAGTIARWSDKIRKCPAWHTNSLENVMPENLPRPSDRRRTNGFVSAAPAVGSGGGGAGYNQRCYSL